MSQMSQEFWLMSQKSDLSQKLTQLTHEFWLMQSTLVPAQKTGKIIELPSKVAVAKGCLNWFGSWAASWESQKHHNIEIESYILEWDSWWDVMTVRL